MKVSRHAKIIELIAQHDIETQEELAEYLNREGFKVTQATVSRDIRDLRLTKVAVDGSRQKYVVLAPEKDEMNEIYPCAQRRIYFHGYGAEYSGDQDRFRNGNGGSGRSRCHEMERSSRVYRRGRYDHVRDQKRTGYGTCDG